MRPASTILSSSPLPRTAASLHPVCIMIGHGWAWDLLQRARMRAKLGHAYLVHGPESVGKTTLVLRLAGSLVCSGPEPRPCGACRGCRQVARGGHPDVRLIERVDDKRDITIEQIRQV